VLHLAAHGYRIAQSQALAGDDEATEQAGWYVGTPTYSTDDRRSDLEPSFAHVLVALSDANRVGGSDGDGLLTAGEAADLDLRGTRLVVLSGCNTASPSLQDGSGAYDLALGFRIAGANSLVASLWPVDDAASRMLMEQLYRALLDGLPVADALWRAKEAMQKSEEYSDPRFWAAFEVFGPNTPVWPRAKAAELAADVDDRAAIAAAQTPMTPRDDQIILRDLFADDRNHWQPTGRASNAVIHDGRYEIRVEHGGWHFATIPIAIPERQDFELSCIATKLQGDEDASFGLVLDFISEEAYSKFTITGAGHMSISVGSSSLRAAYVPEDVVHPEVSRSGANRLRLARSGEVVRFFVNDVEVLAREWPWNFSRMGLLVNHDLTVAFADFKVSIPGTAGQ
jgi:hypothetical protein